MKGFVNLPVLAGPAKRALAAARPAPSPEPAKDPAGETLRMIAIEATMPAFALAAEGYAVTRRLAAPPRRPSLDIFA